MASPNVKVLNGAELSKYADHLDTRIEMLRKQKTKKTEEVNDTQREINHLRTYCTEVRRELRHRASAERHKQMLTSSANKRRRLAAQIDKTQYAAVRSSSSGKVEVEDDDDSDEVVSSDAEDDVTTVLSDSSSSEMTPPSDTNGDDESAQKSDGEYE